MSVSQIKYIFQLKILISYVQSDRLIAIHVCVPIHISTDYERLDYLPKSSIFTDYERLDYLTKSSIFTLHTLVFHSIKAFCDQFVCLFVFCHELKFIKSFTVIFRLMRVLMIKSLKVIF